MTTSRYISVTDTAKLVRAALKSNFATTKFSVKSKSYSMGASITVSWTDGPTSNQVKPIIDPFGGASFDGMTDMKSYHDSVLDGEEVVHFGADYVFANRHTSISFRMKVASAVCGYFKLPVPQMNRYNWFDRNAQTNACPTGGNDDLLDLFNQVMEVTNADDGSLHPNFWGNVNDWIKRVWEHATNEARPALRAGARYTPEGGVIISAALIEELATEVAIVPLDDTALELDNQVWALQHPEDEAEVEDMTPCVKVNPLSLEVIEQPVLITDKLRERLASVDANSLSPIEALTLIYELKRLA